MFSSHSHRLRSLLHLNTHSPPPKCYSHLLLLHKPHPFSTTTTSPPPPDQQSFTISYLTKTFNLSPQQALNASKRLRFNTANKPNTVIDFFKSNGFSNSHIQTILLKEPQLFVSNPSNRILPKFQFLSSKGASQSDIVATVIRSPRFLRVSLQKHIVPAFELVRNFCPSDKKAIASIIACPTSISDVRMKPNLKILVDFGVSRSNIYNLLRTRPSVICTNDLRKAVEEIKELGFDPSKVCFGVALLTKRVVTKSQWDAKVDALKSWGCSEDAILDAFRKHPNFMLRSPDKLNAVMRLWVNEFGWDPLVLMAQPILFGYSIERRLTPRGLIFKFLLSKGLIKKNVSLATPFNLTDNTFHRRYVKRFEEEIKHLNY